MNRSRFLTSVSIFRWATTALIVLIIVLFFKQNIPTFEQPLPFLLNLYVAEVVRWSLKLYVLLIIAAFIGFVLGFAVMLRFYLRARRLLAVERTARDEAETIAPVEPPVVTPSGTEPGEVGPPPRKL